jgi:hypothetical protein
MKRYSIKSTITTDIRPWEMNGGERKVESIMQEQGDGAWVRHDDAVEAIKLAAADNPMRRIEALEKALGLVTEGRCPECCQRVHDWKAPVGSFAPEAWATLKERGIDPHNGHKVGCKRITR